MSSARRTHAALALLAAASVACRAAPIGTEPLVDVSAPPVERVHAPPHTDAALVLDARAVELATIAVENAGGWSAWERTRFLSWRHFGGRLYVWDKDTGDVRMKDDERVVLANLVTHEGRVFEGGVELVAEPRRTRELQRALTRWTEESLWMFLPWRLLEAGSRVLFAGAARLDDGTPGQVLEYRPARTHAQRDPLYLVFVGDESGLVEHWCCFADARDDEPSFSATWGAWKRFGGIRLATEHGPRGRERERVEWRIAVHKDLSRAVFEDPAPAQLR